MNLSFQTIKKLSLFAAVAIIFISCTKENDEPPVSTTDYSKGIFIVNEGPFNSGSGSITWFNNEGADRIEKLFEQRNNLQPLGNLAQSMSIINGDGFIVVNNANLIRSVSMKTFQQKGTIENINLPRYIVDSEDGNAWVSSWDNKVVIFDPVSLQKVGEVQTGTGPERMMKVGEELWVLNQGGYSIDSTVSIIDINAKQVIQTLQVYPKPTGLQRDKNGNVWIMCSGHGWNGWPDPSDTKGHLICINPADFSVIADFEFPTTDAHPEKLEINSTGDVLYYVYPGGIFKQDIAANNLELEQVVNHGGVFYSLEFDAVNSILYATDALDFQQNGWVYRYQQNGTLIDSLQAGIGPTDICIP